MIIILPFPDLSEAQEEAQTMVNAGIAIPMQSECTIQVEAKVISSYGLNRAFRQAARTEAYQRTKTMEGWIKSGDEFAFVHEMTSSDGTAIQIPEGARLVRESLVDVSEIRMRSQPVRVSGYREPARALLEKAVIAASERSSTWKDVSQNPVLEARFIEDGD